MKKRSAISIHGVKQNNLRNLSMNIPLNQLTVITGVSGSGKSSLAFDTLYAEGQRRYVECFSTYTRQFLDRMDRPEVDLIEGILPAIAFNQVNPVKSSRSTVGTMTELTDYMKLLYSKVANIYCPDCGIPVIRYIPQDIYEILKEKAPGIKMVITAPFYLGKTNSEIRSSIRRLQALGFNRIYVDNEIRDITEIIEGKINLENVSLVIDRLIFDPGERSRVIDSLEQGYDLGNSRLTIHFIPGESLEFSNQLRCDKCCREFKKPAFNLFSFNDPVGACPTCHGFGRIIDIDIDLVIPNPSLSLRKGAIKPWTTSTYREAYQDLVDFCLLHNIPLDEPFSTLSAKQKEMIINGTKEFYGIKGFFRWLERKTYKMHIRVLLSKYRDYVTCKECGGTKFRKDTLNFKIGGKTIADVYAMSVWQCKGFFDNVVFNQGNNRVVNFILREIRSRLSYLVDIGVGYLTLDRQSRTLSGGEVQRVNLTRALGSNLVNTLYILDEPSIGLHPFDSKCLVNILHKLKNNMNTIVVVEHDHEIIRESDHMIELGPVGGKDGGKIMYEGKFSKITESKNSLTADYLLGKKKIPVPRKRKPPSINRSIRIEKACANNLKYIDVEIPLGLMVCITGVSGSGKSTLVEEVLYRNAMKLTGKPVGTPGKCKEILGLDMVDEIIIVDQSSIGKTPRGNLLTYMKMFNEIRTLYGTLPESISRGFTPSMFSFNVKGGRCENCKGEGYEKIEMQFLSDIYITCPECFGNRYKPEICNIKYKGKSIVDILNMTVTEVMDFLPCKKSIHGKCTLLQEVGLDYMRLGQPLNTLSGGESQRLKLARQIESIKQGVNIYIFDEPTTGLHYHDIAKLIKVFRKLVENNHTVLIIEHNMEVIKCADYIIDLGPGGGENGGKVVAKGSPEKITSFKASITGKMLKEYLVVSSVVNMDKMHDKPLSKSCKNTVIQIRGVREHNLRNINVDIPRDKIVVITGISGSGKSSLAFDVLFNEGQRRYMENLSTYVRQFVKFQNKPDVDMVNGLPPTIAIEQRLVKGSTRSTVATVTEIYHYLRLLYAKVGIPYCTKCKIPITALNRSALLEIIIHKFCKQKIIVLAPLIRGKKGYHQEYIEHALNAGFKTIRIDGHVYQLDNKAKSPVNLYRYQQHDIEIVTGGLVVKNDTQGRSKLSKNLELALDLAGETVIIIDQNGTENIYSTKRACKSCGKGFRQLDPRLFSFNSKLGACKLCRGMGYLHKPDQDVHESEVCPSCKGNRLNDEALTVKVKGKNISDITNMTVQNFREYFKSLEFSGTQNMIVEPIRKEILSRLEFLDKLGLSYLTLTRGADTLSGGESQRIRLAAQLGSNLRGVCYILDEPTIGLHKKDNSKLIQILKKLKSRGNTIVIVEHDEDTILNADYIVDLGPGAGSKGGHVVVQGTLKTVLKSKSSVTAQCLKKTRQKQLALNHGKNKFKYSLVVKNAKENNLKNINVRFPIGALTCVTGVSGSGKSTLVLDILYRGMKNLVHGSKLWVGKHGKIINHDKIERVLIIDQTPIGKTPRSIPATYVKFWSEIRKIFSQLPESKIRGYDVSRFSFNTADGRCEKCLGQGQVKIEMNFLPNVFILCEHCQGSRYNEETRAIRLKGKSISDILNMTIEEGCDFFVNYPRIYRYLKIMVDMGLGYLKIGQPSNTLSGGEAQRIKLATELGKHSQGKTLYILDEPTTGLHMADIKYLVEILKKFTKQGNTVVVIEHNLDVIKEADWIVDLGPEGGDDGGYLLAEGIPFTLIKSGLKSSTIKYLEQYV